MSWHRDSRGLWCACFLAYQPDDGNGCPAYDCPEASLPPAWDGKESWPGDNVLKAWQ